MLDLIFQLSGALLLSWNQITMSKTDIINSARTIIPTSKHLDHSSAVYVLKRYYLNIIGFSYLAIGYLFSFLDIYTFLQLEAWKALAVTTLLCIFTLFLIQLIAKIRSGGIVRRNKNSGPSSGEIWIDESSSDKT